MKNINFLKFKINNNLYEIVGLEYRENNKWTYDIINRNTGNRKQLSKEKLLKLLQNYEYEII